MFRNFSKDALSNYKIVNESLLSREKKRMFNKIRTQIYFLVTSILLMTSTAVFADIAIIVHPDYQGGELDQEMVRKLFLYETRSFPSGHKAKPANHADGSPDRKAFFEYVLKMSEKQHKRFWSRKKSTGKKPPVELDSNAAVLEWVSNTPLGITYINKDRVDDSVKVLLTIVVFDDI